MHTPADTNSTSSSVNNATCPITGQSHCQLSCWTELESCIREIELGGGSEERSENTGVVVLHGVEKCNEERKGCEERCRDGKQEKEVEDEEEGKKNIWEREWFWKW